MTRSFQRLSSGIVPRLRFTFFVIAAVLCAQMFIGVWQLRTLNAAVADLTDRAVGTLVLTEASERDLKNVLLLLQRVNTATSSETLDTLQVELVETLQDLHVDIAEMESLVSPDYDVQAMKTAVNRIEQGAAQVTQAQMASARHDQNINRFAAYLDTIHVSTRVILETLSFEAIKRGDETFDRYTNTRQIATPQLFAEISDSLALANTLTSLTLKINATFEKASTLGRLTDPAILQTHRQELQVEMRDLVVLMGQLPDSPTRLELARILQALRSLLFEPKGLIQEVMQRSDQQTNLSMVLRNQNQPIDTISKLLEDLNHRAKSRVATATGDLDTATQSLVLIVTFTTIASLVSIVTANFFVVERQINTRMAQLTKAVLSIADGKTQYTVNVSGPDELGKIAKALEVFKVNATELSRSNEELEQFAYAAAHDLRSPLRAIQDLLEWTLDDEDNHFSADGAQNMSLLKNRIERLNTLLSDLLEYSRVGQEETHITPLQMDKVVREVADFLDPDNHYNITYIGQTDRVLTYATPLRQIMMNLVSNGIKHHDKSTGKITIDASVDAGRIYISVSDDGPGVPISYHNRIFGMFETLRPRDEVEGSGLGLAIIRKSLNRYDGDIRVSSDPPKTRGTTFHFDLPERSTAPVAFENAA